VNKPQGATQVKKALVSSAAKNMNTEEQQVEAEVDIINDFPTYLLNEGYYDKHDYA